jgi:hypothetical protein
MCGATDDHAASLTLERAWTCQQSEALAKQVRVGQRVANLASVIRS